MSEPLINPHERQEMEEIPVAALLERAQRLRGEGYRLVHIACTRLVADQEVSYRFDRDGQAVELSERIMRSDVHPAPVARTPTPGAR